MMESSVATPREIALVSLRKLRPSKRNPRTHSRKQIRQIANRRFGWTYPILTDENKMILAGHGRYEAARQLGLREVPVIVISGLSEDNVVCVTAGRLSRSQPARAARGCMRSTRPGRGVITIMRSDSFIAKWQDPLTWADRLDPSFLDYKYEDHNAEDDWLAITAEATIHNPIFKTTINVTLAIRKALHRYLGIEAAVPFTKGRKRP